MTTRVWILAALGIALAGCGGGQSVSTTASTIGTTPTSAETSVKTFFYRDAALVPVTATVPQTETPARAALELLLAGPPGGYDTTLPDGTKLDDVVIDQGQAIASFSSSLGKPQRTAQAQIVTTLTQFPTVRSVVIEVDGKRVPLEDGAGHQLIAGATAADYVDLTADAPIFVRTPARDSTVTSPVHATGTANVFEATFQVEIWSSGKLLDTQTITATSGTGTRGTWKATLQLPAGEVKLVFFEPSAEDGSHLHETEVFLHVT